MKLFIRCTFCKKEVKIKGRFSSRWELLEKKGSKFELWCGNCNQKSTYNVDMVRAKAGGTGMIITSLLLFPCIGIVLWFLYPYYTRGIIPLFLLPIGVLIPVLIYNAIIREQKRAIKDFNSTRPNSLKSIKFRGRG